MEGQVNTIARLRRPFGCETWRRPGKPYLLSLWERRKSEAANYASLTGVEESVARQRMGARDDWSLGEETLNWWERIWR